jgi:transcription elongation factor Elf1
MKNVRCPRCNKYMDWKIIKKTSNIKGVDITYDIELYVCPKCGLEVGTIESASKIQKIISEIEIDNQL